MFLAKPCTDSDFLIAFSERLTKSKALSSITLCRTFALSSAETSAPSNLLSTSKSISSASAVEVYFL